jgi:hypothetical protein
VIEAEEGLTVPVKIASVTNGPMPVVLKLPKPVKPPNPSELKSDAVSVVDVLFEKSSTTLVIVKVRLVAMGKSGAAEADPVRF